MLVFNPHTVENGLLILAEGKSLFFLKKLPSKIALKTATWLVVIGVCCLFHQSAFSQKMTKEDLETEKKKLYEEIKTSQKLLSATRSDKEVSLNDLKLLQTQISSREHIINNIIMQISLLDKSIFTTIDQIDSMEVALEQLKLDYAETIRNTYLTQSAYNKMMFLFSAKDVNEAYRRFKYMQYYSDFRRRQVQQIETTKQTLEENLIRIELEKVEKEELLENEQKERDILDEEYEEKAVLIKELRKQEVQLKKNLKNKESALEELDRQIRDIIEQATAHLRDQLDTGVEDDKGGGTAIPKDALSKDFASNKGKLPWPVDDGVVTAKFGRNRHPVLKHISTNNNGLDIATTPSAHVRSLYEGKISNILFSPSFQWAVIVKHGNYFTVYANLKEIFVNKGEAVIMKQPLGTVYTDDEQRKTEVHLEIWRGSNKLNPIHWIYEK